MTSNQYALTFISADRPGIVADVTRVLFENGFNIADSSSTLLHGFFSMILIVSHPDASLSQDAVAKMFAKTGLTPSVNKLAASVQADEGEHYIISVYGSDKPGIVHSVAQLLADLKINIIDLQTKVSGKEDRPVYIMVLEVTLPDSLKGTDWVKSVKDTAHKIGTDINVRAIETYEF